MDEKEILKYYFTHKVLMLDETSDLFPIIAQRMFYWGHPLNIDCESGYYVY